MCAHVPWEVPAKAAGFSATESLCVSWEGALLLVQSSLEGRRTVAALLGYLDRGKLWTKRPLLCVALLTLVQQVRPRGFNLVVPSEAPGCLHRFTCGCRLSYHMTQPALLPPTISDHSAQVTLRARCARRDTRTASAVAARAAHGLSHPLQVTAASMLWSLAPQA